MNVNGGRFDLLLGRDDWAQCLDGDDERARSLGSWWDAVRTGAPTALPDALPAWDEQRAELGIRPFAIELPATPGEAALALEARRGAAADRHGNVYRIASGRDVLRVHSVGSRRESTFWPADPADCGAKSERARPDFTPAAADEPTPERYIALAVTCDDYLVVAFASGTVRGFLSFDLVAGGEPVRTLWPDALPLDPFDMAARRGGGVWVLDRTEDGSRPPLLWELDGRLAVVSTAQPSTTLAEPEPDDFQPVGGAPRERPAITFPGGIALTVGSVRVIDPIAVEVLPDGAVLLLDRDALAMRSRVVRVRRDGDAWLADASDWLGVGVGLAHDFVFATARVYGRDQPIERLFIATATGNQVRAYRVLDERGRFVLQGATELFPLRRFGGRALLAIRGAAHYDSGADAVVWTPVVHQPRARFGQLAEFFTPVFDSHDLGTTWDRVLLDACVPPDTTIEISSRAADERTDLLDGVGGSGAEVPQVIGSWLPEPRPHLRSTGPELPWLRGEAARATQRESGVGTWELLLQHARGRYLQLRIRLTSDSGLATPRLRALRVWAPRFSYPVRFLPAVYREDEVSGSLLERWLANFESTLTHLEDRIVNVQTLFDPRSAPTETLAWLAEWLDVALDPSWDERRRRLFIAHAIEFFRWRGTVHGLSVALELAFEECFDRSSFHPPERRREGARGIRIVEAYQTRLVGATVAGDPGTTAHAADGELGLREVRRGALWTSGEGNAGLVERYAQALGREATATEQVTPFPLVPPAAAEGDAAAAEAVRRWREFARSIFGFVPVVGAAERARWQRFLAGRHPSLAAIRSAHGIQYASVEAVPLPRDWPTSATRATDWREFSELTDGSRVRPRWRDFLARRYRRIERLNRAYRTSWPDFEVVPLPDALPDTPEAQTDWLQFERQVLAMHRSAHRFSVLLPVADVTTAPHALEDRLGLARRIVELEKPAHTVFDVRFYWAFFRVGEARLGTDTLLGAGSRAPELVPAAVLGRAYIGASFVGGTEPPRDGDRLLIAC